MNWAQGRGKEVKVQTAGGSRVTRLELSAPEHRKSGHPLRILWCLNDSVLVAHRRAFDVSPSTILIQDVLK
jgi:hypothetical protein